MNEREMVFTMGLPAAGKSTAIRERGHHPRVAQHAHQAQPQRHHAEQPDRDGDGALGRVDARLHDLGHPVGERRRDDGAHDQRDEYAVEH